jgi:hypothetical protein
MLKILYQEVVKLPWSEGAVERHDFPGFHEDYLVLHSLIRRYQPRCFMEIGTSSGSGTAVICNAMAGRSVLSVEKSEMLESGEKSGVNCKLRYTQLILNSKMLPALAQGSALAFGGSYFTYPDGWFIDGDHSYEGCKADSGNAFPFWPLIVVWHDYQIEGVARAVAEAEKEHPEYKFTHVTGTRVVYAVRRSL